MPLLNLRRITPEFSRASEQSTSYITKKNDDKQFTEVSVAISCWFGPFADLFVWLEEPIKSLPFQSVFKCLIPSPKQPRQFQGERHMRGISFVQITTKLISCPAILWRN